MIVPLDGNVVKWVLSTGNVLNGRFCEMNEI